MGYGTLNDQANLIAGTALISIGGTAIGWLRGDIEFPLELTQKDRWIGIPLRRVRSLTIQVGSSVKCRFLEIVAAQVNVFFPHTQPPPRVLTVLANVTIQSLGSNDPSYPFTITMAHARISGRSTLKMPERDWWLGDVEIVQLSPTTDTQVLPTYTYS